jgi:hypothetical protein
VCFCPLSSLPRPFSSQTQLEARHLLVLDSFGSTSAITADWARPRPSSRPHNVTHGDHFQLPVSTRSVQWRSLFRTQPPRQRRFPCRFRRACTSRSFGIPHAGITANSAAEWITTCISCFNCWLRLCNRENRALFARASR